MGFWGTTIRKTVFWTYPRTSWQWDVLCVLILVFIFLTPKGWFENTQFRRSHVAQTTVVLAPEVVGSKTDRGEIERRARLVVGRTDAEVVDVRPRYDGAGKLVGYEVDIR
jgi:hypothetical protein